MAEAIDPQIIANVWHQAARKVAALRRGEVPGDQAATWNAAIVHAAGILREEADDVLAMGRMAHLLIVGNIVADEVGAPVGTPAVTARARPRPAGE